MQLSLATAYRKKLCLWLMPSLADTTPKTALTAQNIAADAKLCLNRNHMLSLISCDNPTVVELGVDSGDFSKIILDVVKPRTLHLVDTWGSTRYGQTKYKHVTNRFGEEIAAGVVKILRIDSITAAAHFADASVDLVYIDTDHSYTTTAAELGAWASKITPTGMILGHDYVAGNWKGMLKYGVIEAVHAFCVDNNWQIRYITADANENPSFAISRPRTDDR